MKDYTDVVQAVMATYTTKENENKIVDPELIIPIIKSVCELFDITLPVYFSKEDL